MKPEKSILFNFILVCSLSLLGWFFIVAPVSKKESFQQKFSTWASSNLVESYPEDLIILINKGEVNINKDSPYCFVLPANLFGKNEVVDQKLSGVIFDTKATADISALSSNQEYAKLCKPLALVGKDFVLYPDDNNTYKYSKISEEINAKIDRETVNNLVNQYLPLVIKFGQRAYFIIPFVVALLLFLGFLTQNYWYTLMVKLATKIFKTRKISFGDTYKLSLFFYNFILLFDWVVIKYVLNSLMKMNVVISFPFLNTIIIATAATIYLKKRKDDSEIVSTPVTSETTAQKDTSTPTGQ